MILKLEANYVAGSLVHSDAMLYFKSLVNQTKKDAIEISFSKTYSIDIHELSMLDLDVT